MIKLINPIGERIIELKRELLKNSDSRVVMDALLLQAEKLLSTEAINQGDYSALVSPNVSEEIFAEKINGSSQYRFSNADLVKELRKQEEKISDLYITRGVLVDVYEESLRLMLKIPVTIDSELLAKELSFGKNQPSSESDMFETIKPFALLRLSQISLDFAKELEVFRKNDDASFKIYTSRAFSLSKIQKYGVYIKIPFDPKVEEDSFIEEKVKTIESLIPLFKDYLFARMSYSPDQIWEKIQN